MKKLWGIIRSNIVALATVTVFYLLLFALGITCPIKFVLGISCPGCGMTRAMLSAVLFRFSDAFTYHPLWVLVLPTVALLVYFYINNHKKAWTATFICAAALMVIVYIIRLAFFPSDIVSVNPESSFVIKSIKLIISVFK